MQKVNNNHWKLSYKQARFLHHWGPQRSFGCSSWGLRSVPTFTVPTGNILLPYCRDVHKAFLVETETLKPETEAETEALTSQAEARPKPRPSGLETETRPKRTNSEARPSRGTTAPRDGLETEVSRPRPYPTSTSFRGLM